MERIPASATPSGEPFDVVAWVTTNWWVVAAVIGWCLIGYAWYRLRRWAAATRGQAIRPLHQLIYLITRFIVWDDRGPVVSKPAVLARRTKYLTWNLTYLLLSVTTILLWRTGQTEPAGYTLVGLALIITIRAVRTFRSRWRTLQQMFAVAATDLRYPKGANTTPWAYVKISRWDNLTRPGPTSITVPPGVPSENPRTRDKFEENWKGTVTNAHGWEFEWASHNNQIVATPQPLLPERVSYPLPDPHPWNEFPLGDAGGGKEAIWDVSVSPHILVAGPTGSGKSVLQRNILLHALVSPTWRVLGIDPKKVELGWLRGKPGVLKVTTDLFDSVDLVDDVEKEMHRRYEVMEQLGVNHFLDMPDPPPALLLMVDEVFAFLSPEGIKSDEGKERDEAHARASILIGSIARLGRAAGVHLALATQRPDATVLKGEVKNNLDARAAAGRMDTTPSLMVLDSEDANRLPPIKGRGLYRMGSTLQEFQGYFLELGDVVAEVERAAAANEAAGAGVGDEHPQVTAKPSRKGLLGWLDGVRARAAGPAQADESITDTGSEPDEPEGADEREGSGPGRMRGVLGRLRKPARGGHDAEDGPDHQAVDEVAEDEAFGQSVTEDPVGAPVDDVDVPVYESPAGHEPPPAAPTGQQVPGPVQRPQMARPRAVPPPEPDARPAPQGVDAETAGPGGGGGLTRPGLTRPGANGNGSQAPAPTGVEPAPKAGGGWPAPPPVDDLPEPDADQVVDPFARPRPGAW